MLRWTSATRCYRAGWIGACANARPVAHLHGETSATLQALADEPSDALMQSLGGKPLPACGEGSGDDVFLLSQ